jgi:hypothetical protein
MVSEDPTFWRMLVAPAGQGSYLLSVPALSPKNGSWRKSGEAARPEKPVRTHLTVERPRNKEFHSALAE